jgi:hypothetical protein
MEGQRWRRQCGKVKVEAEEGRTHVKVKSSWQRHKSAPCRKRRGGEREKGHLHFGLSGEGRSRM